jgi:hypothetical protein
LAVRGSAKSKTSWCSQRKNLWGAHEALLFRAPRPQQRPSQKSPKNKVSRTCGVQLRVCVVCGVVYSEVGVGGVVVWWMLVVSVVCLGFCLAKVFSCVSFSGLTVGTVCVKAKDEENTIKCHVCSPSRYVIVIGAVSAICYLLCVFICMCSSLRCMC